jgi:hypothetical protein
VPTPQRKLLDVKLNGRLDRLVRLRRAEGLGWEQVAQIVSDESGEPVSDESLRRWFGADEPEREAAS